MKARRRKEQAFFFQGGRAILTYGLTLNHKDADVLIIGAGGAGARAAIEAARTGCRVTLVCRSPIGKGGLTPTANGGYHAAVVPGDSPASHAEDLVAMGCRLNDRPLVELLTREALPQARLLEEFGATVNWKTPLRPHEPQMRFPRQLFVPGKEVMTALRKQLRALSNVTLLEDHLAMELLTREGEVTGALIFDIRQGALLVCTSKATILASGSLGEIYSLTAQEPMGITTGSTGSGYVLAGWAGAELVDMEMVQFAVVPIRPALIREMRCLPWAPLLDAEGRDILPPGMGEYSHEAAQTIARALRQGTVSMDLRDRVFPSHARHPLAAQRNKHLQDCEVTPYQRPVAIGMGALYMMGGIHINTRCQTSVPGLYAAGEVSGGVHGARRVAGNAFPEMIVFGAQAGSCAAAEAAKKDALPEPPRSQVQAGLDYVAGLVQRGKGDIDPREMRRKTREIMGQHAHLLRSGAGLRTALEELRKLEKDLGFIKVSAGQGLAYNFKLLEAFESRWLLPAARIVCQAALLREESRGFHFREDFPLEDEAWQKHTVVRYRQEAWIGDVKPVAL